MIYVKAISNYIAALITAAMIFTTIAFFVTTSTKQIQVSNYALNTMVEISDRARENLAINTIFIGNRTIITIVNKGTIDVQLSHILFITKRMSTFKYNVNATIIPIGGIVNLNYVLPVSRDNIYDILITTSRGNVFSALYSVDKPLSITVIPSDRIISLNEKFNLTIIITNNIGSEIVLNTLDFNISFYSGGADISQYFALKEVFPRSPVYLAPGEQIVYQFTYEYGGGAPTGIVDLKIVIHAVSVNGEELYSYSYVKYLFEI